ncbi:MAG: beta strand repeat-containing protein, partial [Bacteroidia bacterium]
HTAIATQTVTVIDNINPTITAPATISAHTNSGCAATGVALGTPVTADNCTVASVTNNSPATFPLGNTIVTWTVTDGSGHIATAAQTVTVTDNINPTIIAPANVSVNTNSGCVATGVALGTPVTADNCTVASVTNNAPATFPLGNTIVTWTVTDGSGHTATATQTVTVTDNINPTIIAPATISVNTNSGCSATGVALGTPVTADNCTVASVTNNAPSTFPLGNTTVTWTVTDGSGHTATASQTVTVIDNINPTIIAPANVSVNTNSGCAATGVALGTPVTADNCTVASVTNNAPSTFPLGNTIVTWTVTDGSGHTATAAQTVTVTDNINPTITAPANVSVNTNSGCSATSVALGTPVTADNCTVASVTNNAPATFPLGNTIVTWTVTDGSGHTATASQTVTVIDNINPTITAPATISAHTNSGCSATGVTLGTPVTADNCTVASVTNNAPSTFPLGNTTVTWTVTDGSGHIATAAQTVTVTDNINPTIIAPAAISATPASGACTVSGLSLGTPVTTDNCGVASVTNNSPSAFPVGITTVTWTVTDNSGNIATANQTVTISASSVNYWTGSISNDWFNNSNWCSGIPTASTDVQIPSGAVNMPLINNINAVCRNLTINSGATLSIITNGNISIKGNLVNNGTFSSTGGVVNFNGTSAQTITGVTSFYEMDLNNASGLTLGTSSNLIIHNVLQLINGKITTNANIVTIADSSSVLVTNGYVNGYLKKHIYSGSFITQTFEVGSAAAYTPVTLIFNQAYTTGYLTMNTISSDHPSIATSGFNSSKTVNRYWNVTNSGVTFDFYNIELDYAAADKDPGFIDIYAGAKIYTASGTWSTTTQSNIGTNSVSVENATVFGCIQIGIFNPVPVTASVNPDHGYIGQTMNIVFNGSGFISGVSSVNTVPGVTINSTTINNDSTLTLNVSISATAALGIRKFAITNCAPAGGTSDSLSFTILGHPVASFFANYTAITCNISGNVEFNNYTTNGSTYYWDFGAGASPATATGTGPYTVTYSTTGLKTVRLIAFSPIGNDTLTKVNYINVTANAPAVAASISGPTSVCSYGTSNVVYSTPLVIGVSSYTWTVPAAVTIVSGQGTRNLIVSFGSSFSSGNISVTESNGCGTSAAKSLAVTKTPAAPSTITGPAVICGLSSATYTVAAATGATSYTWTLPSGVTSSLGTSPVTTTSLSITVNFTSTFTSGNLSVISNNSCSSSAAKTIALTKTPPVPGVITGVTSICGLTTATYSVALVSGATGYTWTSPAGVTILSGQGTNSITVSIIAAVGSGNLSVVSTNACTTSAARTLALTGCHAYTQATPIDSTVVKAITTTLYPNPTSGNFNIQYNSEIDSKLIIEMYDVEGKIVFNRTEAVVTGQNSFNYNEEEVKKGIYFIRILDENNNISETKKLLVQ